MPLYTLIPLPYYEPLYYNVILILIGISSLQLIRNGYTINNRKKNNLLTLVLLLAITLYVGLRPISGRYFGDTGIYANKFQYYQSGGKVILSKDILWGWLMKISSQIMTVKLFFLLCATLYIVPLYIACKKWLKKDIYFILLMLIASFSFWPYGTNGIRNGIATSLFVLAVSYYDKKFVKHILMLISYLIHASLIIPIAAYSITLFYKKTKHFLIGWLLAIPISLTFGNFLESFFASLGFKDERIQYLTQGNLYNDDFAYTGFRWDFVLYSAVPVFFGYYFILKKNFNDKIYQQLFHIYLTANAFWILVIRANFSNRFAYLSWFLMAIILFYPFFKQRLFKKQNLVLASLILYYYGFTYVMFLIN